METKYFYEKGLFCDGELETSWRNLFKVNVELTDQYLRLTSRIGSVTNSINKEIPFSEIQYIDKMTISRFFFL